MACVNSRIFFSDCGYDPARTPGRFFCGEAWQRLAVVAAIVHQRPSANLLPALNVNPFTSFQQVLYPNISVLRFSLVPAVFYVPWPWYPSKDLPPLRMYKLPTICGPSALDFVRRIGIVLSQSALPWKMARRFCHLQSVTIDVSCDIVLSSKTSFLSPAIQRWPKSRRWTRRQNNAASI